MEISRKKRFKYSAERISYKTSVVKKISINNNLRLKREGKGESKISSKIEIFLQNFCKTIFLENLLMNGEQKNSDVGEFWPNFSSLNFRMFFYIAKIQFTLNFHPAKMCQNHYYWIVPINTANMQWMQYFLLVFCRSENSRKWNLKCI